MKLIDHGLESLLGQVRGIILSSEAGSMSEATRNNAYNNTSNSFSGVKSKDIENLGSPFRSISGYSNNYIENNYIEEVEKLNRNNIQEILEGYMGSENSIDEYNRRK